MDREIVDRFMEFQKAIIDKDFDKMNGILMDDFKLTNMFPDILSKDEFVSKIEDGSLDYSKSDLIEPTILFDDNNAASLIADVRLTAKINGFERRWISKTVISFQKINGIWRIASWDN
jgi:hypothetical protein